MLTFLVILGVAKLSAGSDPFLAVNGSITLFEFVVVCDMRAFKLNVVAVLFDFLDRAEA